MREALTDINYKNLFEFISKLAGVLSMLLISLVAWQANVWHTEIAQQNVLLSSRISQLELWQAETKGNRFTTKDAYELQSVMSKLVETQRYIAEKLTGVSSHAEKNTLDIRELRDRVISFQSKKTP